MYDGPATIGQLFEARMASRPDHPVVTFDHDRVTYAALEDGSARFAALTAELGLGQGELAAVMLPNGPAYLTAWFGLARAGIVEVPINTAYRGDLLRYVLAQTGAAVLVVAGEHLERIAAIADALPELRHVLVTGTATAALPARITVTDLDTALGAIDPRVPAVTVRPQDRSVVLYTSGTTGPSKGVVLSHNANFRLARTMSRAAGFEADEVLYTAFPLFHVAARYVSGLASMLVDGRVVIHERFSASRFWQHCQQEGVTAIHYLGSLLPMLLKQPASELDRSHGVRIAYGAGAPLPIAEAVEERFGLRLYELYGMTETGAVTMNRDGAYRPGTCGTVLDDSEVEIHDELDRPVAPGVEGEIVVRPREPDIMIEEYLHLPEATVQAFRNLWFHTGDLGSMDADGYLSFSGRQKDAIRRRGENVSAYEVETVLATNDRVAEVAVIGIDDEISGEEICAVVVRRDPALTPEALLDHSQDRLPYFAVPRYVRFVEALPTTPSQRVEKYKLRDQGVTDDTWDRDAAGYEVRR